MTQTPRRSNPESDIDRQYETPVAGMPAQQVHRQPEVREPVDSDDPNAIRHNIEQTRAEMGQTIDRIQDRLDPARLRSEAEEAVREATIGRIENMAYDAKRKAKRAQRSMMQKVKDNPIPSALIGLGVGWFLMGDSGDDYGDEYYYRYGRPYVSTYQYGTDPNYNYEYDYEVYDRQAPVQPQAYAEYDRRYAETPSERRYSSQYEGSSYRGGDGRSTMEEMRRRKDETMGSIREGTDEMRRRKDEAMGSIREGTEEFTDEMQHRAEQLRYEAMRRRRQTERQFNRAMDNNPLAVGALTLAAGALIGLMIPSTKVENEWMGEERDHLLREAKERAQHEAQKTLDRVQNVAEEAKDAATDAAKSTADRTKAEAERQNLTSGSRS